MLQNVFCNFPRYIETIATAFREGGHTKAASLVSPDAHVVLSGPKIINLVNGITISLVDLGLIERFLQREIYGIVIDRHQEVLIMATPMANTGWEI